MSSKNDKSLGKHGNSSNEQSDTPSKRLKLDRNTTTSNSSRDITPASPILRSAGKKSSAGKLSTTTTSSMTIGKPTKTPTLQTPHSPSMIPIPVTTNTTTTTTTTTPKKPMLKKELSERKKKDQMTQEEFINLMLSIQNDYSKAESAIDIDVKRLQGITTSSPSPPTHSPVTSPIMSPTSLFSGVGSGSKLVLKEHHEKKPRILKSDHLPKLSKGPKVSKKIEKLQKKYIRYHSPDQNIRGDWTVRDDYNLFDQIQQGVSPETLSRDHSKYFTRDYSVDDINRRWKSLLYDGATSEEGIGLMVLNPFTPKYPSLTDSEKSVLYNSQINIERQYFINLLQEYRPIFHSSRTSKFLYETFKEMLLNQDISKFPQYISFLKSQKEKIKQLISKQPIATTITANQIPPITVNIDSNNLPPILNQDNNNNNTTTTITTTTTTTNDQQLTIQPPPLPIMDPKVIENENYNELVKFLYNNSLESINNSDLLMNKNKWESILTSAPTSSSVIQNDIILNPYCGIPQYLLSAREEKFDMKSMVKIEREYELDKDRESRSLAIIRGRNIRYLMKSKDILIGRNFSEKNIIDLDLQEEQPTHLNLISKKQLIIKLKSDVNFYIQNIGKNNVFVNGCPIPQNEKIHLQDLSLIEFADIRIVFEINKVFLAKVKRHITVLTNSIEKAAQSANTNNSSSSPTEKVVSVNNNTTTDTSITSLDQSK